MLSFTLAALFGSLVSAAPAPSWESMNSQKMRLVGTSFGVSGQDATYDYVIVGGGTAGLTVAHRLAKRFSVAVIEAGSFYEIDNSNISQIPALTFAYDAQVPYLTDWNIRIENEPGYNNRSLYYARGRCLGGSSGLNAQFYHRPTIGAMDWWARLVGDNIWSWTSALPWYKKSVQFTPPQYDKFTPNVNITYDPSAYNAKGGPLHVSFAHYQNPITQGYIRGLEGIGLNDTIGQDSGKLIGWGFPVLTINPDTAVRDSSETSFLQRTFDRQSDNIHVYQHALAQRVVFDANKKATGVEVLVQGSIDFRFTVSARNEVILTAGALQSPQLLMVSGVGPAETLRKHNIPIVADRRGVGQNLQDHAWFFTTYKVNTFTDASEARKNATYAQQRIDEYLTNQSGPLSNVGADVIGFEKLPAKNRRNMSNSTLQHLAQYPSDWPELEYLGVVSPTAPVPDDGGQYVSFTFILLTPKSRGSVSIAGNDTRSLPVTNFNYLTERADQEVVVQALRRVREWANASGNAVEEIAPGPSIQTDDQILENLRNSGYFIYHAASTCAMGKADDPAAVVDARSRVYGVQGLRVVDASALPFLPPGHPQSVVYMLAERIAADIIRGNPSSTASNIYSDED